MDALRRIGLGLVGLLVAVGVCYAAWRIVVAKAASPVVAKHPSAAMTQVVKEEDLGVVKLSAEAVVRLGVETAAVERRAMKRSRMYGGEVMVPTGRTILVAAPLGGTVQATAEGMPMPGAALVKGQSVLLLQPLISAEASTTFAASKADAEGLVRNSSTQLEAMTLALDRAQRIFREGAGSKRSVEEAQAQADLAKRSLEAAESRLAILTQAVGAAAMGKSIPLPIEAPENGLLRNISALPGQNVPAGGALFEMIDLSQVWVRVPIYVGDISQIDSAASAAIGNLNARPGEISHEAQPIKAPPTATAVSATVDWYYVLSNQSAQLTPGQRVGVTLPLRGEAESLVVPWSAVVHDLQGGTWVYEEKSSGVYKRRRVLIRYVLQETAVLAAGPAVGSKVVSAGAEELFGAETGFSK